MREIYALVDAEGAVRYVGCSENARRRCGQHWRYRENKNTPCAAWLRTLEKPPRHVVLEIADDDSADFAEQKWIGIFRVIGETRLLNVTTGGSRAYSRTLPRPPVSVETRELLSKAGKRRRVGDETRDRVRAATTANWRAGVYGNVLPEPIDRRAEAMRKRWSEMTPEERQARVEALAESRRGTAHSPQARQKMRDAAQRRLKRGSAEEESDSV